MNDPYLFVALEKGPRFIQAVLAALPTELLDRRADSARFTAREAVAHLADWEPIFRSRIETAHHHPGAPVQAYDESERATQNNYDKSHPPTEAQRFAEERKMTIALLRTLSPTQWYQAVDHPERGKMTIRDIASMLVGHDAYHIEQLAALLPKR